MHMKVMIETDKVKGTHFIFDLYGCNFELLNDRTLLEDILLKSADAASMEVLHSHFHEFEPHGITGLVLLSTSHISVHTWPEHGYGAFDVFSCSDSEQTMRAVEYITDKISHERKEISKIERGYVES